ncbi:hypothetical protein Cgig2_025718 [Carnegiea gigantea]|uniref:Large ribosomal subunit protein mL53 n=1 Tax=Carnegiea gigantea TaxID=171969 RepID=A0A9Q1JR69_9CARY|nr:hypothetical protein Cgig2_025718 [Carnegiea gigantea]
MLRFLSKVKLQYNALDARAGTCKEFLAQCISKDSNSSCQVQIKHRTDDHPPQINVTFINGVEEVFDASTTSAQTIRSLILQKGHYLETEQMFRDAGEAWPVIIPNEELRLPAPDITSVNMKLEPIDGQHNSKSKISNVAMDTSLITFTPHPLSQLDVLWRDSDTLSMDGT